MIEFHGQRLIILQQDIQAFEATLPGQLPEEYRSFMLRHNGGAPIPNTASHQQQTPPFILNTFYAIGGIQLSPNASQGFDQWNIESAHYHLQQIGMPAHLLPIGDTVDEHTILLSLRNVDFGTVYAWFNHPDPPVFEPSSAISVFPSFSMLLGSLEKTNITQYVNPVFAVPPWQQLGPNRRSTAPNDQMHLSCGGAFFTLCKVARRS